MKPIIRLNPIGGTNANKKSGLTLISKPLPKTTTVDVEEESEETTDYGEKNVSVVTGDNLRASEKTIARVIAACEKKHGKGIITTLAQARGLVLRKISTGSISLDVATRGGFAMNKVTTLYGAKSSGKTAIAAIAGSMYQRNIVRPMSYEQDKGNRVVIWFDLEDSFDPIWMETLGLDSDTTIIVSTSTGEQTWEVACDLIDSGEVTAYIVFDSLRAIIATGDIDVQEDKNNRVGGQASILNRGLRKIWPRLRQSVIVDSPKHTVVMINHLTMKIGGFGNPEDQPGGEFVKHVPCQTAKLWRAGNVKEEGENKKYDLRFALEKDKTGGREGMTGSMSFYRLPDADKGIFAGSIDNAFDIIPIAEAHEIIVKEGLSYYMDKSLIFKGSHERCADALRADADLYAEISSRLMDSVVAERTNMLVDKRKG